MGVTELICKIMQGKDGYFYSSEIKAICEIDSIFSVRSSMKVLEDNKIVSSRTLASKTSRETLQFKFEENAYELYQTVICKSATKEVSEKVYRYLEMYGEKRLCDLEKDMTESRSSIYKNLKSLVKDGVLKRNRSCGQVFYKIAGLKQTKSESLKQIVNKALNSRMRASA